jgi:branched-chain amino acid transport system permease protein
MSVNSGQRRKERLDRGIKVRSDGIYALMSFRELCYLVLPRAVLIGGMLILPLVVPAYWQKVVSYVCIYALLTLSFDFLAHFVGLVSLGGAFFVGIGGYLAAILNTVLGLPPLLSIPLATLLGACICTILLLPCLPLRGVYFAIVTLMYPLLFTRVIEALDIFGGTDGMVGVTNFTNHYFIIIMLLAFLFGIRRLVNQDLGLVLRAVKDNDQAVRASGMSITYYKTIAVFIGSGMGCLAGAYLAHVFEWAGLSSFALDFSILPIAATVIGGAGTLVGPVLGAFILVPLNEWLRDFGTLRIVIYALILLAFIIFRSEGIMVYGMQKYHQFEKWVKV